MREIERKWLMNPECLEEFKSIVKDKKIITQSYISRKPEIRLRKRWASPWEPEAGYFLDIKGDGDLSRFEISKALTEEEYNLLYKMADPYAVLQKEYLRDFHGIQTSITQHLVSGCKLFYGEVEFNTEEEANAYVPPPICAEELTYNEAYKMKNFAFDSL
jgi:CYTH domain-containing protein